MVTDPVETLTVNDNLEQTPATPISYDPPGYGPAYAERTEAHQRVSRAAAQQREARLTQIAGSPITTTYGAGLAGGLGQICTPTSHYFECRHESRCRCGAVRRITPEDPPEGF